MPNAPASNLLLKLSRHLFGEPSSQAAFVEALTNPSPYAPCIAWCGDRPADHPFEREAALPWQPDFVDRLSGSPKPGQHPLHEAGAFYCLDFSSVFAASPLTTVAASGRPINLVVDMCASPGGKSILAWNMLCPQTLLSNEVIGKRVGALISNLKRCHIHPAIALCADPQVLAEPLAATADVVLVDAPCTGQSLLAKGQSAPGCFHPVTINKNANRQKRILANSAAIVAPQGHLLYMTCAYSPEENEQVCSWLLERFPQFQPVAVPMLEAYQSHLAEFPCYRMFPQSGLGAGAFTALFQNMAAGEARSFSPELVTPRWSSQAIDPIQVLNVGG